MREMGKMREIEEMGKMGKLTKNSTLPVPYFLTNDQ